MASIIYISMEYVCWTVCNWEGKLGQMNIMHIKNTLYWLHNIRICLHVYILGLYLKSASYMTTKSSPPVKDIGHFCLVWLPATRAPVVISPTILNYYHSVTEKLSDILPECSYFSYFHLVVATFRYILSWSRHEICLLFLFVSSLCSKIMSQRMVFITCVYMYTVYIFSLSCIYLYLPRRKLW